MERKRGRQRKTGQLLVATSLVIVLVAGLVAVLGTMGSAATPIHRINAGGPDVSGPPTWNKDTKGSPSPFVNALATGNKTQTVTTAINMTHPSIPAGTPQAIFKAARFDPAENSRTWNGTSRCRRALYILRLYFAETVPELHGAGSAQVRRRAQRRRGARRLRHLRRRRRQQGGREDLRHRDRREPRHRLLPRRSTEADDERDRGGAGPGSAGRLERRGGPAGQPLRGRLRGARREVPSLRWREVAPRVRPGDPDVDHQEGVAVQGASHPGSHGRGKIYLLGGLTSWPTPDVGTVFIYDPDTNTVSQGTPMPASRQRGAGGVGVYDGKIYYAGGLHNGLAVNWFDVYDPVTDTWTQLPDMPTARDHFQASVLDGRFWAIGGRNVQPNETTAVNEAFDFGTGQWVTGFAPLPTPRGGFASAVLGRRDRHHRRRGLRTGLAHRRRLRSRDRHLALLGTDAEPAPRHPGRSLQRRHLHRRWCRRPGRRQLDQRARRAVPGRNRDEPYGLTPYSSSALGYPCRIRVRACALGCRNGTSGSRTRSTLTLRSRPVGTRPPPVPRARPSSRSRPSTPGTGAHPSSPPAAAR